MSSFRHFFLSKITTNYLSVICAKTFDFFGCPRHPRSIFGDVFPANKESERRDQRPGARQEQRQIPSGQDDRRSSDAAEVAELVRQAETWIKERQGQLNLDFSGGLLKAEQFF